MTYLIQMLVKHITLNAALRAEAAAWCRGVSCRNNLFLCLITKFKLISGHYKQKNKYFCMLLMIRNYYVNFVSAI